jgi:hypothetical protein
MRILHLSDTPLSGSPVRISGLLSKYGGVESRHITWKDKIGYREFPFDIVGSREHRELLYYMAYEWPDVIHYHNRWKRQEIFKFLGTPPPNKPSVIQIHSPRDSENFGEELASGIPLACLAQYHGRQWPTHKYLVPNVVDIYDPLYMRDEIPLYSMPRVSYAPSNTNMTGWNDKSYSIVGPVLKRMRIEGSIIYDLIQGKPFCEVMPLKRLSNIGVEEVSTGSMHLSGLEYLSLGIGCIARLDELTEKAMKDVTGADALPWISADKGSFERILKTIIKDKTWYDIGIASRKWMEQYWNPEMLCGHYIKMYEDLK